VSAKGWPAPLLGYCLPFFAATAARRLWRPDGLAAVVLSSVSGAAIVVWSLLEIVRGASPFRRVLGSVVLLAVLAGLVLR
jgi:hypothetical protein